MLPSVTVPAGLAVLLAGFRGCFTAPTFATFSAMVVGSVAAVGRRTVCAMLVGAGLSRQWSHDRAHWFFSRARWEVTEVGLTLARLVVDLLLPPDLPIIVVVDDTLFKRWGPKVFGRAWQHDGAAKGPRKIGSGVCFVVAGIIVERVPLRVLPMCLPVLSLLYRPKPKPAGKGASARTIPARPDPAARRRLQVLATQVQRARTKLLVARDRKAQRAVKLARNGGWLPGSVPDLDTPIARAEQTLAEAQTAHQTALDAITAQASTGRPGTRTNTKTKTGAGSGTATGYPTKTELAIAMVTRLAAAFPDRTIHVVADAAYHSKALRTLPNNVTWTFRLPKTAVLYQRPPAPTGKPGRPPVTGDRLGTPAEIAAATTAWQATTIHRRGEDHPATITVIDCRWHNSLGATDVRLILIRNADTTTGYDLALLSTDPTTTPTELANRYATRWAIEVVFHDSREHLGAGQPHNRTPTAVHRTTPFQLLTYTLVIVWYTTTGHHPDDLTQRRWLHPWYNRKTTIAFHDMITKLRHTLTQTITEYPTTHPDQPTPQQFTGGCPTCRTAAA